MNPTRSDCKTCGGAIDPQSGTSLYDFDVSASYEAAEQRGYKLYLALAFLDTRDGSLLAQLVQAAREGFERSDREMDEDGAWDDFERIHERLAEHRRSLRGTD